MSPSRHPATRQSLLVIKRNVQRPTDKVWSIPGPFGQPLPPMGQDRRDPVGPVSGGHVPVQVKAGRGTIRKNPTQSRYPSNPKLPVGVRLPGQIPGPRVSVPVVVPTTPPIIQERPHVTPVIWPRRTPVPVSMPPPQVQRAWCLTTCS